VEIPAEEIEEHPTKAARSRLAGAPRQPRGDVVLDTFGGSGSTLIACERDGRACQMTELDPRYVDVIVTRWENFTGRKAERVCAAEKVAT
jgi:DNA modification methylase